MCLSPSPAKKKRKNGFPIRFKERKNAKLAQIINFKECVCVLHISMKMDFCVCLPLPFLLSDSKLAHFDSQQSWKKQSTLTPKTNLIEIQSIFFFEWNFFHHHQFIAVVINAFISPLHSNADPCLLAFFAMFLVFPQLHRTIIELTSF